MELDNHTPCPAEIFRTIIDQERFAAAVFTRITFDVAGAELRPSAEQRWPVSGPPWECEYGAMDSDEVFYRGGVDVFLFGHARAPAGRPVPQMQVRLQIGSWSRSVLVTGDRVWWRQGRSLVAGAPQPFREMPLTLQRAFGGSDEWDGLQAPYPDNPEGVGFYLSEESAEGRPLPNVEDPAAPVRTWEDRPDPASFGVCLQHFRQRLINGIGLDDDGNIVELKPTFFNSAFPPNILPSLQAGEWVRVDGVREDGPVMFRVPDAAPRVRLRFDDEVIEQPLAIDQIGIEPDRGQVFIAYRYPFRYVFHPLQRRTCELLPHRLLQEVAP